MEAREKTEVGTQREGGLWVGTQGTLLITGRREMAIVQNLWTPRSGQGFYFSESQAAAAAAAAAKSLQLCPTLCDPIDGSLPGSPVPGILQARTLERVAISFSRVAGYCFLFLYQLVTQISLFSACMI